MSPVCVLCPCRGESGGDRGEGSVCLRESGGVPAGHHEQPGAAHTETYPLKRSFIQTRAGEDKKK